MLLRFWCTEGTGCEVCCCTLGVLTSVCVSAGYCTRTAFRPCLTWVFFDIVVLFWFWGGIWSHLTVSNSAVRERHLWRLNTDFELLCTEIQNVILNSISNLMGGIVTELHSSFFSEESNSKMLKHTHYLKGFMNKLNSPRETHSSQASILIVSPKRCSSHWLTMCLLWKSILLWC